MSYQWYVVNVTPGAEGSVAKLLRENITKFNMAEQIQEVLVPAEEVVEVRRGQKRTAERKFFPGYVLVKMDMSDEAWHFVKNTNKVKKFLGHGRRPTPIPEKEAMRLIQQVAEAPEKPKNLVSFEVGDRVRVKEGAFESFEGVVEAVDEGRERIKVSILIFGRPTPTELEYAQVEKL